MLRMYLTTRTLEMAWPLQQLKWCLLIGQLRVVLVMVGIIRIGQSETQ